jgi:hypothetical protein
MKMGNTYSTFHNTLADYFFSKGQQFSPSDWDKCSNRIPTELPFQILHSSQPPRVNFTLCNPMFLDSSIKKGLLNNLLEDLKIAVINKNLKNIIPVRNSVLGGITAIRSRASMSIYSIVNRLKHEEIDEVTNDFLKLTIQKLDRSVIWLNAETKLPNVQQINGIIDINTDKNNFYVLNESCLKTYDLETNHLKAYHQLFTLCSSFEVAINPITERIATLDKHGNIIIDSVLSSFKLKQQLDCFKWFLNGIIGINMYGMLVYIDLIENIQCNLWEVPILPYSFIEVSKDLKSAIVVSGDRPNNQQILLLKTINGKPVLSEFKVNDMLVNTASLDQSGSFLLLSSTSRELWLFNTMNNDIEHISYRIASNLPVRGRGHKSSLATRNDVPIAVLATTDGELLCWDIAQSSIRRIGMFKGLGQNINIHSIDFLPEDDKLIFATNESIEIVSLLGEESLISKSPVNQCCFSNDGWFIYVNEQAKKITWVNDGKYAGSLTSHYYQPISITSYDKQGVVAVGFKNGSIGKFKLNVQMEIDDGLDLFDGHPITSIINWGNASILAVSKNGQIKITSFESVPKVKEIKPVEIYREELITCKLGNKNDILTCGRSHSGESLWSIVVIRENDSREVVFESKEMVTSITASDDGNHIYWIIRGNVYCYIFKKRGEWELYSKRETNARHVVLSSNNILAVILKDKNLNWLELWDSSEEMKTITAMDLPFAASCINSLEDNIGIGSELGEYCLVKIRGLNLKLV